MRTGIGNIIRYGISKKNIQKSQKFRKTQNFKKTLLLLVL